MSWIPIRADNGFPECNSCAHFDSGLCEFCDDADQWEQGEEMSTNPDLELLAA